MEAWWEMAKDHEEEIPQRRIEEIEVAATTA